MAAKFVLGVFVYVTSEKVDRFKFFHCGILFFTRS